MMISSLEHTHLFEVRGKLKGFNFLLSFCRSQELIELRPLKPWWQALLPTELLGWPHDLYFFKHKCLLFLTILDVVPIDI